MEKQKESQRIIQDETQTGLLLNFEKIGFISTMAKYMKRYFFIGGLAGIGLLFNGCFPGYVSSQPSYTETYRPSSPSSVHVWVEGSWAWNRHSKTYVQTNGHWAKPNHHRKFVAGHWKSTPKGHRWVKGHWTR